MSDKCKMNASEIVRKLQPAPPPKIEINNLNQKTAGVLLALLSMAEFLRLDSVASAEMVMKSWPKAWPWLLAFSRAVLDTQPSTVTGFDTIEKVLTLAPFLFMSYLHGGTWSDHELDSTFNIEKRICAYPELAALALELWLLGTMIDHELVALLCDSAGGYSVSLFTGSGNNRSPARSRFLDVLSSTRWDLPKIFVKGIVREASRKLVDCGALRNHMSLLNTVVRLHPPPKPGMPTFLEDCAQKGLPRWATYGVLRTVSPKRYDTEMTRPEDPGIIVKESLLFLGHYFETDNYAILGALDDGIIYSLFRHRDLIVRSISPWKPADVPDLARAYSRFLDKLARRLYHRPLMVRAIRTIKRVAKEGIYADSYLKDCGPLLESWNKFCTQATARHVPPGEHREGWYEHPICGNANCPYRKTLKMNHKFKRCGECRVEIYCSQLCQKAAWKTHRTDCEGKKKSAQDRRDPTSLELAFLRECVYRDFYSEPASLRGVVHRIFHNEHTIIFMNYTKTPKEVKPIPLSWVKGMVDDPRYTSYSAKDLEEAFSAVALVAWRERTPFSVFVRDPSDRIVNSQAAALNTNCWQLALKMNEMLRRAGPGGSQ
ncbi:hypothetical protein V5O48_010279 [Marasmius crinis-equi]|uniref:MYND-type domain-containing protein n=1 Tax=Marasmius crinis-equi TaxID=585013 RepID=A0ABR3F8R2_9AGAR